MVQTLNPEMHLVKPQLGASWRSQLLSLLGHPGVDIKVDRKNLVRCPDLAWMANQAHEAAQIRARCQQLSRALGRCCGWLGFDFGDVHGFVAADGFEIE